MPRTARTPRVPDRLTRTLALASVGLGVVPLAAPARFARAVGVGTGSQSRTAVAAVGVRELAAAGLLLTPAAPLGLWARVAGDVTDLALLRRSLRTQDAPAARRAWRRVRPGGVGGVGTVGTAGDRSRVVAALGAVAALGLVDLYAAVSRSRGSADVEITSATTVLRTPQEVYEAWRRFEDLPRAMRHLERVERTGARTSHWVASAPFGRSVEWDAETTDDRPGERLAWRSLPGARIANSGDVRFVAAPGDRGTELRVRLTYRAPAGALGRALARWASEEPRQQLDDDLRRFKQVLETGEVVRSDGAPGGKHARHEFPQHAAQPLSPDELAELSDEEVSA